MKALWRLYYMFKNTNTMNTVGVGKSDIILRYARINGIKVNNIKMAIDDGK